VSLRIGSLFSGYGGLDMGVRAVVGGDVVWHADIDPHASRLLAHHHPDTPNLGDVSATDWAAVPVVDVLTGGFPCQDVSTAGLRAGMADGTRSGLWTFMADAIATLRPSLVVIENVKGLLSATADSGVEPCPICVGDEPDGALRALGAVLGDLAGVGYDARWGVVEAADAGAPHHRGRVFVVAQPADAYDDERAWGGARQQWRPEPTDSGGVVADASGERHGCGQDGAGVGLMDGHDAGQTRQRQRAREEPAHRSGATAPDAEGHEQREPAEPGPVRHEPGASTRDHGIDFGAYAPAVRRWEHILGRPAPNPTEPGNNGPRLSPRFVEWMMGLPCGWVTDVPGIPRSGQLKLLGNGVVPQQAALALEALL
jgi:DNA (cytosine-5)-methyltransferase 1